MRRQYSEKRKIRCTYILERDKIAPTFWKGGATLTFWEGGASELEL